MTILHDILQHPGLVSDLSVVFLVCQPRLLAWLCTPVLLVLSTGILTLVRFQFYIPVLGLCHDPSRGGLLLALLHLFLLQGQPLVLLKPCTGLSHSQAGYLKVTDIVWTTHGPGSEASLTVRHKAVHHKYV